MTYTVVVECGCTYVFVCGLKNQTAHAGIDTQIAYGFNFKKSTFPDDIYYNYYTEPTIRTKYRFYIRRCKTDDDGSSRYLYLYMYTYVCIFTYSDI